MPRMPSTQSGHGSSFAEVSTKKKGATQEKNNSAPKLGALNQKRKNSNAPGDYTTVQEDLGVRTATCRRKASKRKGGKQKETENHSPQNCNKAQIDAT